MACLRTAHPGTAILTTDIHLLISLAGSLTLPHGRTAGKLFFGYGTKTSVVWGRLGLSVRTVTWTRPGPVFTTTSWTG